jgi:methionyl-tRNA formyltransferase
MNNQPILFLGTCLSLIDWLRSQGEEVIVTTLPLNDIPPPEYFIISYGYRHKIKKEVIDALPGRIINLHISYLPWNRGADPNLWSWVYDTPKGVTIHYIDEGIDTGDIILRKIVRFPEHPRTLRTTYEKLHKEIQKLFKENWQNIKTGNCHRIKPRSHGSYHNSSDKDNFYLPFGWDTPIV